MPIVSLSIVALTFILDIFQPQVREKKKKRKKKRASDSVCENFHGKLILGVHMAGFHTDH